MNSATQGKRIAIWLVLLAAAGTFALTMGTRQTMGLFLSPLNTSTGLGLANISLAFAFGQLWWGLTQPFAGAMADKVGAGRVLFTGALLVARGTFITPLMTTSCLRTRPEDFSAPGWAARCSKPRGPTTGSGTSISCWPQARR